jgi:hypothetical protein
MKLFRNRPDLRFDHRTHEQILPAIRAAGGEVAWTDLYVVHSGSDQSPAGQAKKFERDFRILDPELGERPEHPFTLFNLGMTHCHASHVAAEPPELCGYMPQPWLCPEGQRPHRGSREGLGARDAAFSERADGACGARAAAERGLAPIEVTGYNFGLLAAGFLGAKRCLRLAIPPFGSSFVHGRPRTWAADQPEVREPGLRSTSGRTRQDLSTSPVAL